MKNISFWALMNPVKSISLIVMCQTLLSALAVYFGVWLFAQDVILPPSVSYVGLTLFFLALIFYPIRRARHKIWKYNFVKQKSMDVLLVSSFMMTAIAMSNSDANAAWHSKDEYPNARLIVLKNEQSTEISTPVTEKKWSRKEVRKALKSRFKQFVSEMKANAGKQPGNAVKIVGLVILTIFLMLVVAALACFAGCSGGGTIATVFVLAIGWALALWMCISVVRRWRGKRKTKYEPMPQKE